MRFILASLLVLIPFSLAHAQWGWGGGYHSSTLEEGVQRGFADVVRSQGAANLMNSMAAVNAEEARKKYLENRLQATQTFFDMRRINAESRRSERSLPLSNEAYVRLARQQAPDRLSVSQLDPLTGMISWPAPLRRDAYQENRDQLERLFKERASGVDDNYDEIRQACTQFLDKIKADISTFQPNDFIRARKFIESLSYELLVAQR
jgi:hypothetical protein